MKIFEVATMSRLLLGVFITVALVSAGGCRTAPIYNVSKASLGLPPDTSLTIADVAKAVSVAGQKLGWQIEETRPGEATGTLTVSDRHVAVVSITYDRSTFSLAYKDSKKLLQSGNMIHKEYNAWVHLLEVGIQREAQALTASK